MALIVCPECGKDISDKVKVCPHCGYPIATDGEQNNPSGSPQQVEVVSVKVDPRKSKKIIIGAIAVVVLIAVCTLAVVTINRQKEAAARTAYIDNLMLARSTMLVGAADSENLCNLTKSVWYNTIHEERSSKTDPFTRTGGAFNEDFNVSLTALYADSSTLSAVNDIKANQEAVAEIMKDLQNPPNDLISCFETIETMYDIYSNFTNLAISPSGSLNSYSENFSTYDNEFMRCYNKLNTQIPSE